MCDAAESCDGAAAMCPVDGGIAALCQPMTPIHHSALGRNVTFTGVNLDGTGGPVASVAPGATVRLRVTGSWADTNTSCPGCATQFYARMNGVFSLCLGNSTEDMSFDETTTFTAPSTPGVYIVNPASSWQYECLSSTAASTAFSSSSIATLIVE